MFYLDLSGIKTEAEAMTVCKKIIRQVNINNNDTSYKRFTVEKSNDCGLGALLDICITEDWMKVIDHVNMIENRFKQANAREKAKSRTLKPT